MEAKDYLAIDIGGTRIKYGLLDRAGTLIEKGDVATPNETLSEFVATVRQIVQTYRFRIRGVAFSAPGKVDHGDETIYAGGGLPFLDQVNLADELQLDIPVAVENDGKAAALAELWLGNLTGIDNGAAVVLGTGVGGGLILNGALHTGAHFQAGELSFMHKGETRFDADSYGKIGSAVQMIETVATVYDLPDVKDGRAVFELINLREGPAWDIFKRYTDDLVLMLLNMQAVIDVQRFVIGGGITAQPIVVETIRQSYEEMVARRPQVRDGFTTPEILPARFGNDANLYGALYHLLLRLNHEV
ncbi:ROK family protein [Weissella cibaria]|uniref:ROK family protein n=1 Tax=Weissella cibaria TaxID=137591 RepID=UPI0039A408E4